MSGACDILVVGGGPAGAVTALRLARLGFEVHLVEAESAARPHIGESITIGVHRLLDHLGLEAVLETAEPQYFDLSEERWSTSRPVAKRSAPGAATVNRARFDEAMLERCRREGVRVTTGQRVQRLRRCAESCGWDVRIDDAPPTHASFVVDAAGRRGILPRSREAKGARTIALFAYWNGGGLPAVPRVYAGEFGWAWGAPVRGLGYNVTLFVDRELIAGGGHGIDDAYRRHVGDIGLIDRAAAAAAAHSRIVACDATAWLDRDSIGDDFVKVGEAAHCLDPLGSTGVQNAIQTAIWASIVVNTTMPRPRSKDLARRFYEQRLSSSAATHVAAAADVYASCALSDAPFWERRAGAGPRLVEDPFLQRDVARPSPSSRVQRGSARVIPHACLSGDFVEERPAVVVDASADPVAFLGSVPIADIVGHAEHGCDFAGLEAWMAKRLAGQSTTPFIRWLISNDVLRAD